MCRVIGRVRFDSRAENSHPRANNRKLSVPHIVLKGTPHSTLSLPDRITYSRCTRGFLAVFVTNGVLFSGALSSLETCHASLGTPRISRRTMLDTDNAVRTSKISQKSGNRTCASRFTCVCCVACSRARACESPCGDTFAKREKNALTRVPLDQRQSTVKQWRAVQRGFYCIAERAKSKAQCGPFVLRDSALPSYPRTLGSVRICSFLHASFFFFLPFLCTSSVARMSIKDALFGNVFILAVVVAHAIVYTTGQKRKRSREAWHWEGEN